MGVPISRKFQGAVGVGLPMDAAEAARIIGALWDRDAALWDREWAPIFRPFAEELLRVAQPLPGERALDVGCGSGLATIPLAAAVGHRGTVLGIDQSEAMVALARGRALGVSPRPAFKVMNSTALDLPTESLDLVVSNCGLFATSLEGTLHEIRRVLKRGGRLTFNDWAGFRQRFLSLAGGEVIQEHVTPEPPPALAEARRALAIMNDLDDAYADSQGMLEALRAAGFTQGEATTKVHDVVVPIDAFMRARLDRAYLRMELEAMGSERETSLRRALRKHLRTQGKGGKLRLPWQMVYYTAVKP